MKEHTLPHYPAAMAHPLGRACFDYRCSREIWIKCNVAAMSVTFKGTGSEYQWVAHSDKEAGHHSEEAILGMFDSMGLRGREIEKMELFTELAPCASSNAKTTEKSYSWPEINATVSITESRDSCRKILIERPFPQFNCLNIVKTVTELGHYLSWQRFWSGKQKRARQIYASSAGGGGAIYYCMCNGVTKSERVELYWECARCKAPAVLSGLLRTPTAASAASNLGSLAASSAVK